MNSIAKKILLSCIILLTAFTAYSGLLDEVGVDQTEQSLKRALVTFAIARGLNAVISVAQGTEVAVEPAGIGVKFAPGEILDPVNDLIEHFSWMMLASATALGIQRLLLGIFGSEGFTLLLLGILAFTLIILWLPRVSRTSLASIALRLTLFVTVLRFAVPVLAIGSEALYAAFLQEQYESATTSIEAVTETIGRANRASEETLPGRGEQSMLEKARRFYDSAVGSMDVSGHMDRFRHAAEDVSEQVVNLTVIFIVQTVLLPLLFLWGFVNLLKRILGVKMPF